MMHGKVALVTGAAGGIGRASAIEFGRQGARVVIADVDLPGLEQTAGLIESLGGEVLPLQTDVSRASDVRELVKRTVEVFGGLDCAHNNAGIEGPLRPLVQIQEEDFDRLLRVNLKGVWLCMQQEIEAMLRRGAGAIVNTSSVAGIRACPGAAGYAASKHAVIGLSRTAAVEYASHDIRINSLCPGLTVTPMTQRLAQHNPRGMQALSERIPQRRAADPVEIARVAVWLCSATASYLTGQEIVVDGGATAQ